MDHLEEFVVDRKIISKWVWKKWDMKLWTGFIWLKIGSRGGFLWKR